MRIIDGLSLAAIAAALAAGPATAQTAPPPALPEGAAATAPASGQRYTPADFARFAPRTALDMVDQLPGFAIVANAGGDTRGLGAARENILINGERIADKSTDARTALSRIGAASVRHIDVVDGASLNVPGLTGQVANIVLLGETSRKFTTTLRWTPEARPRLPNNWLWGEVSTTGPIGGSTVTISLSNEANRQGHWGPEQVFDGAGNLLFVREEFGRYFGDRPRLAFALARTAANGNKLNFNLAGQLVDRRNSVTGTSIQPGIGRVDELFRQTEEEWNANIGGDYEFGLGKGRLKLIGQHWYKMPVAWSLAIIGGTAALETTWIEQIEEVDLDDLNPESLWKFRIRGFGPLLVAMDAHGGSLYTAVNAAAKDKRAGVLAALGVKSQHP